MTSLELEELHAQGGVSLLPSCQEDVMSVKMLTVKHPEKVLQRLNYIMAEFNFILDMFDFSKADPKYQNVV